MGVGVPLVRARRTRRARSCGRRRGCVYPRAALTPTPAPHPNTHLAAGARPFGRSGRERCGFRQRRCSRERQAAPPASAGQACAARTRARGGRGRRRQGARDRQGRRAQRRARCHSQGEEGHVTGARTATVSVVAYLCTVPGDERACLVMRSRARGARPHHELGASAPPSPSLAPLRSASSLPNRARDVRDTPACCLTAVSASLPYGLSSDPSRLHPALSPAGAANASHAWNQPEIQLGRCIARCLASPPPRPRARALWASRRFESAIAGPMRARTSLGRAGARADRPTEGGGARATRRATAAAGRVGAGRTRNRGARGRARARLRREGRRPRERDGDRGRRGERARPRRWRSAASRPGRRHGQGQGAPARARPTAACRAAPEAARPPPAAPRPA